MRIQSRSILVMAFSALLAACGEGSSNDPKNVTDTSTPKLTSSTPSSRATAVQIDQEISLVYSTDIDAKTVNDMTVMVMPMALDEEHEEGSEMDTQRIKGMLTTTGKTIKFMPTIHFERGQGYHVLVKGVKSTAGVLAPAASIAFRTRENPRIKETRLVAPPNAQNTLGTREYQYNPAGALIKVIFTNKDGALQSTTTFDYDAVGDQTKMTQTDGVGAITGYTNYATPLNPVKLPDAAAVAATEINYNASGMIAGYRADFIDGEVTVARLIISAAGADGLWNFGDDILSRASKPAQLVSNAWVASRYVPAITPSTAIWDPTTRFTNPTLQLQRVTANFVNNFQRTWLDATYSSVGENGVDVETDPTTGKLKWVDDAVTSYSRRVYDASTGRRIQTWSYSSAASAGPGPDAKWFTDDDIVVRLSVREYDPMRMLMKSVTYTSAGADNDWLKVDDNNVSFYTIYTYTGMNRSKSEDYTTGVDLRIGGNDDVRVVETTYDTTR